MKAVTKSAFYHLKNISKLRQMTLINLLMSLCPAEWTFAMASLQAFPKKLISTFPKCLEMIPVVMTTIKRNEHIAPVLMLSLHWIPVRYGIDFKALLLVFKSLNGLEPTDLFDMFQHYSPCCFKCYFKSMDVQ